LGRGPDQASGLKIKLKTGRLAPSDLPPPIPKSASREGGFPLTRWDSRERLRL